LTWIDTANDFTGFNILRQTGTGAFQVVGSTDAAVTSFSDPTVTAGATYTYEVEATDANGPSSPSNQVSITTNPNAPLAPTNLRASGTSGGQVTLTWVDVNTDAEGFKIERATGSGSFAEIMRVGANLRSFSDTTVAPGVAYSYRVRAFNSGGDSAYSNTVSAQTTSSGVSGTVTIASGSAPIPAAGITVQLLSSAAGATPVTTTTDAAGTYAFRGLTDGSYTVSVIALGQASTPTATVNVVSGVNNGQVAQNFTISPLHVFGAGISLVSLPYDYGSTTLSAAALLGVAEASNGSAPIATYNPLTGVYLFYPALPGPNGQQMLPGHGYWIRESAAQPLGQAGRVVPSPFQETLQPGWNLIGDPFTASVPWSTAQFSVPVTVGSVAANTLVSQSAAVTANLIGASLWAYDPTSNSYVMATSLQPFQGYWVFVNSSGTNNQPVTLQLSNQIISTGP